MPKQITARNVTRGNLYFIYPEDLILQDGANSRRYEAAGDVDFALDLLDHGQLVPILCRRDGKGRPVVIDGHRRTRALRYLNEEKLGDGKVRARCEVIDADEDQDAFRKSVKANASRKDLSAVDHAYAISRLDSLGVTRAETAKLFGRTQSWVSQTAALSTLPARVQRQVHDGKLAASTAYELAGKTTAEIDLALRPAEEKLGRTKRAEVRKTIPGTVRPRTSKEVRLFFAALEGSSGEAGPVEELAGAILQFIDGKIDERSMENRLRELAG